MTFKITVLQKGPARLDNIVKITIGGVIVFIGSYRDWLEWRRLHRRR